jgi:hypothetical protein
MTPGELRSNLSLTSNFGGGIPYTCIYSPQLAGLSCYYSYDTRYIHTSALHSFPCIQGLHPGMRIAFKQSSVVDAKGWNVRNSKGVSFFLTIQNLRFGAQFSSNSLGHT